MAEYYFEYFKTKSNAITQIVPHHMLYAITSYIYKQQIITDDEVKYFSEMLKSLTRCSRLLHTYDDCFQKILDILNDMVHYYFNESYIWEYCYDWIRIKSTLDYLNFFEINDVQMEINSIKFSSMDSVKSKIVIDYEDVEYTMNFLQFHFLIQEDQPNVN